MAGRVEGKVAFVTGAARGQGLLKYRATAQSF
jgi:NAD(P)-dependent dehydrogenase (short-subunit alcohol dehydrogenase family)